MAGVAAATLWITGQMALWVTGIQALAIVVSLLRRERPWLWQTSPMWLNLCMFAVVGATISVAFESANSVIALAHFAALTQGLQLLDARPRRSEFLLVALSLFQVILAANLTDSLLFLPLLALFVVATTWTLIVHTLRTEAAEAGDASAAARAITPGLLRTAVIASGLSILLAAVLFVLLPRMRTSIVNANIGGSTAMSGFSDRVELGTIGRIRRDTRVVLRVETLEGQAPPQAAAYWRGLAFDQFDGREWSITPSGRRPLAGSPRLGIDLRPLPRGEALVQRIVREPVQAGVLFAADLPHRVEGALHSLEGDVNGGIYDPSQFDARVRYTVTTSAGARDDLSLRGDRSTAPRRGDERFTTLPGFDAAVAQLAREITRESGSDSQRASELESHLRRTGRYTDTPQLADGESGRSPIEDFLLESRPGHCEYFASGMVVLARSVGLHARLVNGFAGGRVNRLGGFTELLRSDAHAWVEIHYAKAGWVRYDPTPPDLRLRSMAAQSLRERVSELRSAVELWWFQRVVDFDSSDQIRALKAVWAAVHGTSERAKAAGPRIRRSPSFQLAERVPWRELALAGAALGLALFGLRRRGSRDCAAGLDPAYGAALRLLSKRGLVRGVGMTARDFAREVAGRFPAPAAAAFDAITESYLSLRFGGRVSGASPEALEVLRRELVQSAP